MHKCYLGDISGDEDSCEGRRKLQLMECSGKKEYICKIHLDHLEELWYCDGGLKLCEGCEGNCRS